MATYPLYKPLQFLDFYECSEGQQETYIVSMIVVYLKYGENLVPKFKTPVVIAEGSYSATFEFEVRGNGQPGTSYACNADPVKLFIRDKIFLDKPSYPDVQAKKDDIHAKIADRLKTSSSPATYTVFTVTAVINTPGGGSSTNTISKDAEVNIVA
jgi:hypothetical protein